MLGARLKAERENRGLTLEQVATSTKIPVSLLEGLERNDLSRWPKALYRRAFFRSYLTALGCSPEPFTTEFVSLFGDDATFASPVEAVAVVTAPGDAPGAGDAAMAMPDGGVGADGGPVTTSGGCCTVAPGSRHGDERALWLAVIIAGALGWRRSRRDP
jgi:transcriptional regulator with XRE-family HTH domain